MFLFFVCFVICVIIITSTTNPPNKKITDYTNLTKECNANGGTDKSSSEPTVFKNRRVSITSLKVSIAFLSILDWAWFNVDSILLMPNSLAM